MADIILNTDNLCAEITPAGVSYIVADDRVDGVKKLLTQILCYGNTQPVSVKLLKEWTGNSDDKSAFQSLYRLQKLGLVRGTRKPRQYTVGPIDDLLPLFLEHLSAESKALLADYNGLYVSSAGFPHESAEELAALAADLTGVYNKHKLLLQKNLRVPSYSWGLIEPNGLANLSFFNLYINGMLFTLIIGGSPRLGHFSFVELVYQLLTRYTDNNTTRGH